MLAVAKELVIDGVKCIAYSTSSSDLAAITPYVSKFENEVCYTSGARAQGYINIEASFDIETTTVNFGTRTDPKYNAFMYHWQFAIGSTVVFGRYWDEYMLLLEFLEKKLNLDENKRLVIYSHFASYEFQFLRNFIYVENIFARKKRVVIKTQFNHCFEMRCSWALSNMALKKAIQNTPGAHFKKQSGDAFDYLKLRTPSTPMSDDELIYCYCDVAGLNEYLRHLLETDTIASLPLTSTGFIRRDVRKEVLKNPKNRDELRALALNEEQYFTCKIASRGGNCHGNAMFTNIELDTVSSYDRKSSYPAEMMVDLFPVSAFQVVRPSKENLDEFTNTHACLILLTLWNVKLKDFVPIPYIALAKCCRVEGKPLIDNGRIVKAKAITLAITDIDWHIIYNQYHFSDIEISKILIAEYGHLNNEFRYTLRDAFVQKCKLEGGDPYLYAKFKNKINAYFGMMLTDICSPEILYNPMALLPEDIWKEGEIDIDAMLNRYYGSRNSFLSYQHGIWVTANARYRHQQGIDACAEDTVYGDTDSVKYIGEHDNDFAKLNLEWLELCENNDISPSVRVNGKTTTLGVWEKEKTAEHFVFLGAKKYAYTVDGKLHITVAGLSKEKGAKWLEKHGGLNAFTIGTIIPKEFSGRTASKYIDVDEPYEITVNGETFTTGSSIATVPVTYEFGVSDDYLAYFTSIQ